MASNYWESTQRKYWTFTKQQLAQERKRLQESKRDLQVYPLPDLRHLSIYISNRKVFISWQLKQTLTVLLQSWPKWQDRSQFDNRL
jgi:hypothetical protein